MLRKLAYTGFGLGLLALGVLGLVLPFLPGILFLFLAALCFAALSPKMHRFLSRHPRMAHFFRRVEQGRQLGLRDRAKLTFWACLEALGGQHPAMRKRV